ncbi:hypothetical protein KII93_04125 [Leuconostoc gelidum subsp. gasicomitatum]|uniref:hypothetical protein n=1 Tax=Leuconostoc gasicomitatum TaxID=115778 RepID=UPI0007E14F05|nr:hypothetical protein [Leuconostoc gasicomitatum]MBZ5947660.1 hypothetical protein [Leuconostoc gasicomitatum]CUW19098.1 hypothetical protein PB1E_0162 [Leuconostoc gasicomitatum]
MKSIQYTLISAFIVWIVNQVTNISKFLGLLIFITSIFIFISINFFMKWKLEQKNNVSLQQTIDQLKIEKKQLLNDTEQLQADDKKLQQKQTALNSTIDEKNNSINSISHRADLLGYIISILISTGETEKLAPLVDSLLKIGEYPHDK